MTQPDKRRFAPAVERNRNPILEVLRRALPATGAVLELASGTGEHAAHFATNLPHLAWQPSDADPEALESIARQTRPAAEVRAIYLSRFR